MEVPPEKTVHTHPPHKDRPALLDHMCLRGIQEVRESCPIKHAARTLPSNKNASRASTKYVRDAKESMLQEIVRGTRYGAGDG